MRLDHTYSFHLLSLLNNLLFHFFITSIYLSQSGEMLISSKLNFVASLPMTVNFSIADSSLGFTFEGPLFLGLDINRSFLLSSKEMFIIYLIIYFLTLY